MAIHGRLLIAAGFLFLSAAAQASGLRLTPLRLDFGPKQNSGQIEVTNLSATPMAVQVKAFRWTQKDGVESYEPTTDLFFAPPIVSVAPESKTIVRFRLRAPAPATQEAAYRVYFQEIPPASQDDRSAGMNFRTRFGVPVFVQPVKAALPALTAVTSRDAAGLHVRIRNDGKAHIRVANVRLYLENVDLRDPRAPVAESQQALSGNNYVFPGNEAEWVLPLAAGADPARLKLMATTDDYSGRAAEGMTTQGYWWVPASAKP